MPLLYPRDANMGLSASIDRKAAMAEREGPFQLGFNGFLQGDRELVGLLHLKSNSKGLSCMNSSFLSVSL